MSAPELFDHSRDAAWLMGYAEGELEPAQAAAVATHLEKCADCRAAVDRFRRETRVLSGIRLREAPPEPWEEFWRSSYNRLERGAAWVVLAFGATVLAAWGLYHGVAALLRAETIPAWIRIGILAVGLGLLLLLGSVVRERLYAERRTRYKQVVR
jgi:anti-sigma factor RsiW